MGAEGEQILGLGLKHALRQYVDVGLGCQSRKHPVYDESEPLHL